MTSTFQASQTQSPLSKYEVIKPLGRGAGSFVYKIKDRKTGKHAALKVIEKKNVKFQKIRPKIQNEIEIQSKLDNEHIVKLLTHFEDDDNYYIMLELCDGGEIYNKIKAKGKLNEDEVRTYGFQFAKGLKYMHDNNIMHRDLKLSNLLLTEQGSLKICDFGLSVYLTDMKPERETLCGTPNYLAPELVNHESYGIKADCWAFGCILYAMATGNPPFEGESVKDTLLNVRKGQFQMPEYIPKQLKDLLANLMNWDPNKRFNIDDALSHPFFASCSVSEEDELSKYRKEVRRILNSDDNYQRNKVLENAKLNQNNQIGAKRFSSHTKCQSTITASQPTLPLASITNMVENRHLPPRQPKVYKGKENASTKLSDILNNHESSLVKKNSEPYGSTKKILTPINLSNIQRTGTPSMHRDPSADKSRGGSISILQNSELRDRDNGNSRMLHKRMKTAYEEFSSRNLSSKNLDHTLNTSITLNTTSRTYAASPSRGGGEQFLSFVTEEDAALKTERRLHPLNTFGLTPSKFGIKNGTFEIDENGIIDIDFVQSHGKLTISPDGSKVTIKKYYPTIEEKTYALAKLPSKYNKFYEYASKVCEVIKLKIPKIKIEDEEGSFCLLQNKPFPHFEAKFKNGLKAQHTLSSEIVRLDMNDGSIYEINILRDTSYLGDFLCSVLNKTLEKMDLCVQKEIQSK